MAAESNWLSFSLSSMEMLNSSSSNSSSELAHHHHYYSFADNFYASTTAGWPNQRAEAMYTEAPQQNQDQNSSSLFTTYMHPPPPPKLEDFFGGDSSETQESSLTHIYDHHQAAAAAAATYVDLKSGSNIGGFSANSGSEVDDSGQTRSPVESATELVGPLDVSKFSSDIDNTKGSTAIVVSKKVADTFGQRTSIYRGVTRHRWTGRYEAHLWDNSCRREGQARKGRQVYLGGYDNEDKAARAYDLAALKYWGSSATTNFPITNYTKEVEEMEHVTKQEFIASLRRKSSGFSRGASIYRGVTRHHQQGRWQARIGRVAGNKDLYLGTFATEEEAAEAYDIAAIKFRGVNAVTNFEMSRYDVEAIANSTLPIGGTAKRLKVSLEAEEKLTALQPPATNISFGAVPCGVPFDQSGPLYHHNLFDQQHCTNADNSGSSVSQSQGELFIWPHQNY